ncbi:hypothetical protein SHJG_0099 [Streptomyces hygroscopicus subsp. jinggangensis 5008]|nr:hypothetical protein SHJG_0099 [Streptomyces hygroscopicus subsp. jinggangensis 5008]
MACFVTGPDVAKRLYDDYRRTYAATHGAECSPDRLAYGVGVYVADTEAEARAGAEKLR